MVDKKVGISPPIEIVQFGEGKFIGTLVTDLFQQLNDTTEYNGSVVIVSLSPALNDVKPYRDYRPKYHIAYKGLVDGKPRQDEKEITCIEDYVNPYSDFTSFINLAKIETLKLVFTESIKVENLFANDEFQKVPTRSSIGKLVQFLHARFTHFKGDMTKGLHILSFQQIQNGQTIESSVTRCAKKWKLESLFLDWLDASCNFFDTFADRIISSEPPLNQGNKSKSSQKLTITVEPYFLWVIKGRELPKPLHRVNTLDIDFHLAEDLEHYIFRKERVFDGIKTIIAIIGLNMDKEDVDDVMQDDFLADFVKGALTQEISFTLKQRFHNLNQKTKSHPLNPKIVDGYNRQILSRLNNPLIKQNLSDIGKNSLEKFQNLVLPTLLEYHKKMGYYPLRLIYVFACLIVLYSKSDGHVEDNEKFINLIKNQKTVSIFNRLKTILENKNIWSSDLSKEPLLTEILYYALEQLSKHGVMRGFYFFYRNQVT